MKLIVDNSNYDNFLNTRFISGNFLQSSIWKDFLQAQGLNVWQVAVLENQETIGFCLLYENKLPFGKSYLYSPKGPIISATISLEQKEKVLNLILSKIRDVSIDTLTREELFCKLEIPELLSLPPDLKKSEDIQPRDTLILQLDKDLPGLLADMHAKTRYNISLAMRKGVKVRFSTKEDDLKHFLRLIKKTATKNQITVHSDHYYQLLWQTLIKHQAGQLCIAELDQQVLAVNLVVRFGSAMTYLHGASDYRFRSAMAPHTLQWQTIKQAKELGYKIYDFWGIAPADNSKPNWEGFTRFKKGFGGTVMESPGAHDLVYNEPWYRIYLLSKKVRKILRK